VTNFFKTLSFFRQNRFIDPNWATLKHIGWAFRKTLNCFPCDLQVGSLSIRIANRTIANGVGALLNALGYYDPNNMFLIEDIFSKKFAVTFFDIGANIGVYSLIASARSEKVRVVAFEPHPSTHLLFEENIRLNRKEKTISCFQIALGDENADVLFQDFPGNAENRVLTDKDSGISFVKVRSQRGDTFCAEHGIAPEILKIDVEGFENQVLSGFGKSLVDAQVIFVECWNLGVTAGLCRSAGFSGPFKVDYKNRKFVYAEIHYEDWVFINSQAIPKFRDMLEFEFPGG
jgi:FkbM family methyltransferase